MKLGKMPIVSVVLCLNKDLQLFTYNLLWPKRLWPNLGISLWWSAVSQQRCKGMATLEVIVDVSRVHEQGIGWSGTPMGHMC